MPTADELANAVKAFTKTEDFSTENKHIEHRAELYRAMCDALKKYEEEKNGSRVEMV
jgi:hypothetical protein